jgi:hypothetical protein
MAQNGNTRKLYLVDTATNTYVVGQTSVNTSLTNDLIETSDKLTEWTTYISGKKSWSATVSLNLDNTATAKQLAFVEGLTEGKKVKVFIGVLNSNEQSDGIAGEAWVAQVDDTADNHAIASRSITLTGDGEPTVVKPQ